MSTQRFNAKSFDTSLGDLDIHIEKMTLDITDNGATAMSQGRPDGWLMGDVSASGEIEVTLEEFKKLTAKAQAAGSCSRLTGAPSRSGPGPP